MQPTASQVGLPWVACSPFYCASLLQRFDLNFSSIFAAVPFEEDDKDPSIWFLDHSYMENMFRMF